MDGDGKQLGNEEARAATFGGMFAHNTYITGNLGVGISAPTTKLEVDGTASSTGLQVNGNAVITGTINGQTISSAANFTGSVAWSGGNSSHLGTGANVTTYVGNSSVNNALIRSNDNSNDAWVMNWGDSASWGIYNRNIDSALVVAGAITVPPNSTAFIGAGLAMAYIDHQTGNAGFVGTVYAPTFSGALSGHASLDLALTGGTMSGAIAMGSNNITGGGTFTATSFSGPLTGAVTGHASLDLALTGGTMTGVTTLNGTNFEMGRSLAARSGISWYDPTYTAWSEYMASAGTTSTGPHGNLTAPSGSLVTSWALRSFVENVGNYGWTFESGSSSGQPSVVAEIRSSDGAFRSAATVTGSTGINTGAGIGTNRIDASGNLANIGTITSGLINGQTISSAANFTGSVTAASFSGPLTGNVTGSAYTLIGDQTNWATYRSSTVANMLSWKNYGNGHVIFDASNATSPTGAAVNSTNSANVWTASYPTLMGWNGSSTYGVRVDSARLADLASGLTGSPNITTGTITSGLINGQTISSAASFTGTVNAVTGYKVNGAATAGNVLRGDGTNFISATLAGSDITGQSLTKTDDTNVTLTLGGTPATALLRGTSIAVGWSGQLAVGRGGTGASTLTGVLKGNGASAFTAMTGTANYSARWTDANTIGTGALYDNGTNVGIGTTTPGYKLDVSGDINFTGTLRQNGTAFSGGSSQWTTGGYSIYYNSPGYVGIGTTNPQRKLDVITNLTGAGNGSMRIAGYQAGYEVYNYAGTANWYFANNDADGNKLYIGRGYGPAQAIAPALTVSQSDFVGIGTTNPTTKLQVGSLTGLMNFDDNYLTGNATGSAMLTIKPGPNSGSTASGYMTLQGKLEAWVMVNATSNTAGQQVMRFGNGSNGCTNCFAIQNLNDTMTSITATPFRMQNNAPTGSFVMLGTGYVGLGLGTTDPANRLELPNASSAAGTGRAYAWITYSSGRWKENVTPISSALDKITMLNPVYFDWKAEYGGKHDIGFIAEQVGKVVPELVQYEANGVDAASLDYAKMSSMAIAGIKELNSKTDSYIASSTNSLDIFRQNLVELAGAPCIDATTCVSKSLSQLTADVASMAASSTVSEMVIQVSDLQINLDDLATQVQALEDMASTTLAVNTAMVTRIAIEEASSTVLAVTSSTSFIETISIAVQRMLQTSTDWFMEKLTAHIAYIDRVEAQTVAVSKGLEMSDQSTGSVYCVTILDGELNKRSGSCETASTTPSLLTPPPAPAPAPAPVTTPAVTPPAPAPAPAPVPAPTPDPVVTATSTPDVSPITIITPDTASSTATTTPDITAPAASTTPMIIVASSTTMLPDTGSSTPSTPAPDTTTPAPAPAPVVETPPATAPAPVDTTTTTPTPAPAPAPEPAPAPALAPDPAPAPTPTP